MADLTWWGFVGGCQLCVGALACWVAGADWMITTGVLASGVTLAGTSWLLEARS